MGKSLYFEIILSKHQQHQPRDQLSWINWLILLLSKFLPPCKKRSRTFLEMNFQLRSRRIMTRSESLNFLTASSFELRAALYLLLGLKSCSTSTPRQTSDISNKRNVCGPIVFSCCKINKYQEAAEAVAVCIFWQEILISPLRKRRVGGWGRLF